MVLHLAYSVKTSSLCKQEAEPHKYMCGSSEFYLGLNGPVAAREWSLSNSRLVRTWIHPDSVCLLSWPLVNHPAVTPPCPPMPHLSSPNWLAIINQPMFYVRHSDCITSWLMLQRKCWGVRRRLTPNGRGGGVPGGWSQVKEWHMTIKEF